MLTTTIGSFPQTNELRLIRRRFRNNKISKEEYETYLKDNIKNCVKRQEEIGLDILVHGEFERSDMVEYFAENLSGFSLTDGEIQSYGTRFTRPPVITGNIERVNPFTVDWIRYAQSLTSKPVKGMLTGPVTIVQWSYPREDISREEQIHQVAESLRLEFNDLVKSGVKNIQIDEPALKESLPINRRKRDSFLESAVNSIKHVYKDRQGTTVYLHMCYSEFSDIMDAILDLNVDVLHIEESKSQGKLAEKLINSGYKGILGLGTYDVHSPRIPTIEEIVKIPRYLLDKGIPRERIMINPDCGLKTRGDEAYAQLEQMVKAKNLC